MTTINNKDPHRGRLGQIPIYLGKFFRMFIYVNDWKVLPMAAIIAGLVAKVAATNMCKTQEGTIFGALALACICVWNGCFNSIQVVCRERDIVKREHRDGMHISSYICAHMIYQAFLCLCQTVITIVVCRFIGLAFPTTGCITPYFNIDLGITIFLATYAADMLALMISSMVRNTTSAMTVMPFVLIFQLLFSGAMFGLEGFAKKITSLSIAKWTINALCMQSGYNDLPMVTVWNQMKKFRGIEVSGYTPVDTFMDYLQSNGNAQNLTQWMGGHNQNAEYVLSAANLASAWMYLLLFAAIFAVAAILFLEKIDHDKR